MCSYEIVDFTIRCQYVTTKKRFLLWKWVIVLIRSIFQIWLFLKMFNFKLGHLSFWHFQFPPAGGPKIRKLKIFGEIEKIEKIEKDLKSSKNWKNWKNVAPFSSDFLLRRKFSVSARIVSFRRPAAWKSGNWIFSETLKTLKNWKFEHFWIIWKNWKKHFQINVSII